MNHYQPTETSSYMQIMLEHTSVGMAVYDALDLCLLEANTTFLTIFENLLTPYWQHGKILGHCLTDWCFIKNDLSPRHHSEAVLHHVIEVFHTVAQTGIPYRGAEYAAGNDQNGPRYWNWAVDPVRAPDGHIVYLVHTASEITEQIRARKQAEQENFVLAQTNSTVEAERKRLEVIETVARCVRDSQDAVHLGNITIEAIRTHFHANSACLHIADSAQRVLRLLCSYPSTDEDEALKRLEYIPFESMVIGRQAAPRSGGASLVVGRDQAQGEPKRDPVVIEDMQDVSGSGRNIHASLIQMGRGYICVPLWFGDQFEGTLCAIFPTPIRSSGPEVRALVGSGIHIAAALAQVRLQTLIEREHSRLRAILDQLPEGILIAEVSNGTINYANPAAAQILGIALPDLIEVPLHQHPWSKGRKEEAPESQAILPWNFVVVRALCGDTIKSKETLVVRPDGSKVVTLTSSAPLYTDDGIMTGAMIVFQDVTMQKSLEQHKNDFLSIANHELRTPITVIQGFAEILQLKGSQDRSLDPLTTYALTSISEQSQHLTHLIEEMLDISRIEQAQFTLKRSPRDLLALLRRAIESQAITTRQHTLHLVLEGLPSTDTLVGFIDEGRMIQVLNNLVSNAIKYSPCGGDIEIGLRSSEEEPHEALIWVKDHGIGIAAHEMQNIFKRFHRAGNIDRSTSGFGIGLYLVKEVVVRHGGRVWVESTEGKGSTFYVMLPLNTPGGF
ncbi:MAG TPA: ATP-binding protein [Ktedonosporobacter sp.]|nr:ATP-binding protein [Ktedonosporobacter sp.]